MTTPDTPESQHYAFVWEGLHVALVYCPDWSKAYRETFGYPLAWLSIHQPDGRPLPITETGYLSHFTPPDNIEAAGGPVACVQEWLDEAAQDPAWQAIQDKDRQMSLF